MDQENVKEEHVARRDQGFWLVGQHWRVGREVFLVRSSHPKYSVNFMRKQLISITQKKFNTYMNFDKLYVYISLVDLKKSTIYIEI